MRGAHEGGAARTRRCRLAIVTPTALTAIVFRAGFRCAARRLAAVGRAHVVVDDRLEFLGDALALQRHRLLAIDIDRRHRRLAGAGQRNADVGELRLARTVDDAAHHGDVHRLPRPDSVRATPASAARRYAWMLLGQFLEDRAGGAAAARTGGDHRRERAQAHGLQDFLRDDDLARAVAVRLGRERNADRVADAFLQQHRHRRRRRDDALAAHAGFGQAQVQRIVAALRERRGTRRSGPARRTPCTTARCGRRAGRVPRRAARCRARRRSAPRASRHRLAAASAACALSSIMRASRSASRLPQLTPMRTGLPYSHRLLDHHGELRIALAAVADVARIDPVLGERARAVRILGQQLVAVEVKVADQRHGAAQRRRAARGSPARRPPLRRC